MQRVMLFIVLLLNSTTALSEYGLNLTQGVTSVSRDIYDLHMLIFWICVAIAVIVFGAMFYSIFKHRKSKDAVAANFHDNTSVELAWTAIPMIILVLMAIPASKVLIDLENSDRADMTIKITGHQWKWEYEYPKEGIRFISNLAASSRDNIKTEAKPENYLLEVDKPLVLPIGTNIRFLVTSNDVIHSWWVRDLGVKQDANPGFINDAWAKIDKVGTYRGQCTELCGKDHAFMPVVVEAVTKADYKQWVAGQQQAKIAEAAGAQRVWSEKELLARGKEVFDNSCAVCHKKDGSGIPPVFPAMQGSKIANGDALTHINLVLHGKAAMPPFNVLSDIDIAAAITYERRSFGNNGDVVQPSSVKSAR